MSQPKCPNACDLMEFCNITMINSVACKRSIKEVLGVACKSNIKEELGVTGVRTVV